MAKVLEFVPADEKPHKLGKLACRVCGNVSMHVWPEATPMLNLACPQCGFIGSLQAV